MASSNVHEFNDGNFETEVLKSSDPVLVDFWAEWCQPCRLLAPTIDQVADEFQGKVKVGKIDIDSNRDTAINYQIASIPTVMIFKDGQVVKKFIGLKSREELADALSEAATA